MVKHKPTKFVLWSFLIFFTVSLPPPAVLQLVIPPGILKLSLFKLFIGFHKYVINSNIHTAFILI